MSDNWIQTYTGRKFSLINPRPEDIDIRDIAHALSLICRFTGHCNQFYSVAQHSLYVSQKVSPQNQLWGLLHDAAEAYIGDMSSPVKTISNIFPIWKPFETRIMLAVAHRFNLNWPQPAEVKTADLRMLVTEKRDLMGKEPSPWFIDVTPYSEHIKACEYPRIIESSFIDRFNSLTEKREINYAHQSTTTQV